MSEETRETTRLPRPEPPPDISWPPAEKRNRKAQPRRAAPKGVRVSYWFLALLVLLALMPTVLLVYATEVGW